MGEERCDLFLPEFWSFKLNLVSRDGEMKRWGRLQNLVSGLKEKVATLINKVGNENIFYFMTLFFFFFLQNTYLIVSYLSGTKLLDKKS